MTNKNRVESFGVHSLSWLDKIIYYFRVKALKKHIVCKDKVVLDVWCWYNATFLIYVKDTFSPKKAIAYDLSLHKDFLDTHHIESIEWDLNNSFHTIWNNEIDVVFATAILEHLSNPVWFLQEIYKILKPGGVLLLTTPSIWSKPVLEFLAYRLKLISRVEIEDHKDYYDRKKLLSYCQKAWFSKENVSHSYFEIYMNNLIIAKK